MKKLYLIIGLLTLTITLSSCDELNEGPYTITFEDEVIESIEAEKEETIELPFLETENGFFLGWEDPSGVIHNSHYTVNSDMTLTPVYELFTDVLELQYDEETQTVSILSYSGNASRVKIPHMINDYIVRSIGIEAFAETSPTRIDIPMTVYSVRMRAFSDMPNLKEVHYYGEYLGTIENILNKDEFDAIIASNEICQSTVMDEIPTEENPWIFETGCPIVNVTKRTNPVIGPDGNEYFSYHVLQPASEAKALTLAQLFGMTPFIGSHELSSVTLPDKYSFFESEVFKGVPNLESVNIENNPFIYSSGGVLYERESNNLVYYPSGLMTEHFIIPSNITKINAWAFINNHTETITMHEDITFSLGAFAHLEGLKHVVIEGEDSIYTAIDGVVFNQDQTSILFYPAGKEATSYTIPNTVTTVEAFAFMHQQHLEDIIISEGVESIDDAALMFLPSIKSIDIASTVDYLGTGNLSQREKTLETIIIRNDQNVIAAPALHINITDDLVIYVPDDLITDYENDMWWQHYAERFIPLSQLDE